jgi:hypothetical protein
MQNERRRPSESALVSQDPKWRLFGRLSRPPAGARRADGRIGTAD